MGSILQLRGAATGSIPGPINDLATPTLTSTSVTTNFSVPTGTITGYQYRIDGGTAQTLSGPGGSITGMTTGVAVNIEVRAINGGNFGPWSNLVVANPGLDVRVIYDTTAANLKGSGTGSWEVTPGTTVETTIGGPYGWPDVGFPDQASKDGAEAVIDAFVVDLRQLVDSIGTLNLYFGMGRLHSQFTGNWNQGPTAGTNTLVTHSEAGNAFANYAAYQAKIAALPNATQKALWPDPGSFPIALSTYAIDKGMDAIWTNDQTNTAQNWVTINASPLSGPWDTNSNVSTCAGGQFKFNWAIWHEVFQGWMGLNSFSPAGKLINGFLYYQDSGNTPWQGNDVASHISIDGGGTSLGAIQTAISTDLGSLKDTIRSALSYEFAVTGQSMVPASHISIPSGNALLFRDPNDAKILCAMFPPSALLKTLAGL